MKIVLTHIGSSLPPYIIYCLRQLRLFNPTTETFLIAGRKYLEEYETLLGQLRITPFYYEELEMDLSIQKLRKISWFGKYPFPQTTYPSPPNFWHNCTERYFAVESFMRVKKFSSIFYVESDVLVYSDLEEIESKMDRCPKGIYAIPVGKKSASGGLLFVDTADSLARFCRFVLEELPKGKNKIGQELETDFICDMELLAAFSCRSKEMHFFPILPQGEHSSYFREFESIFDPASWGQFLGGTNSDHPSGFIDGRHFVGEELLKGKYHIVWEKLKEGRVPYVVDRSGEKVRLNNLHIHSKQLEKFLSI
jgi:hypothetical protein